MDATRRALIAGAAVAALAPRAAAAAEPAGDAGVLTAILRAEQALAYVYEAARTSGLLDADLAAAMGRLRAHEAEHVAAVARRLEEMGAPRPEPPATVEAADALLAELGVPARLAAVSAAEDALRLALALEEAAVALAHRAVARLEDLRQIQAVAAMMAAGGQHLVLLRLALGAAPVPRAVEDGA